ncbi:extracellular solute-binding protein [Bradyrhizobium sp. IC3069]|uniref:ABC transporter substrate-binding protein n=1 Tax=unclassified Bradyrhizobium TaxID=2631580 RepID=UPI001CD62511|nr:MULTISPECIES: extracellular solute-binding protein [unclassified Bradyrhizobium]MCA1363366.1 extracellular solute-binding protein [Bradyrhizobium sp. IC4059]MCA1520904.1 extracellular solute-binding protein [Bradyrhizobium sp. IC3069]
MFTSRREFLKSAASAAALGTGMSLAGTVGARAEETITAVEWGGNYANEMKKLAAKQSDVKINWQLHAGGAMAILPKIKSKWPKPGIDLLTGWEPSWQTIAREGWAEPVTLEKVPNLADIPQKLLVKDSSGNIINIPRTITAAIWFYREDKVPFQITNVDDLLDPRLKGKICFPVPTLNSNLQMLMLALDKGGDERNMEPAWEFMKKLARSGNIGRVANADTDVTTSITSGETCITTQGGAGPINLARQFKIQYLSKMDKASGFRTFVFHEGWCVLKGGRADAAFKFADFAINPGNNAEFNEAIHAVPANGKSKIADEIKPISFNNEEMDKYVYIPDWAYLSTQTDAWMKRWEQEIAPLL